MKALYAHLDSYGLSAHRQIPKQLAKFKRKTFEKFFGQYREIVSKQPLLHVADSGATDIYPDSWGSSFSLPLVQHLALYVNRLYVHDPLLKSAEKFDQLDVHFGRIIREPSRSGRLESFRSDLEETLKLLLTLRPLAEIGIIHIAATGLVQDSRAPGELYAKDFYGPSGQIQGDGVLKAPELELPESFADYVTKNIRLHDAGFKDGKLWVAETPGVSRGNTFAVEFDGDDRPMVFMLSSMTVDPTRKDERVVQLEYQLDRNEAKDPDTFRHWVIGESQRFVRERLTRLYQDLLLAASAKARFLTTLRSSSDLAGLYGGMQQDEPLINALLQLKLPYFEGVSLREIAKARKDEAAFADFRDAMSKAFREIDRADPSKFQAQADQISRDLILTPLAKIDERVKGLSRNTWIEGTLLVGTLAASIVAAGATLVGASGLPEAAAGAMGALGTVGSLGSVSAILKAYKEKKAADDALRQLPSYFYWQMTKAARARKKKQS